MLCPTGYFMEIIDCDFAYIYHKIYVHHKYTRVLVSDIFWSRKPVPDEGALLLSYPELTSSPDIDFGDPEAYYEHL